MMLRLEEWQCLDLFQFCSDLKCANILFAIGGHGSYCSCYICEGHKVDDDNPDIGVSNKKVKSWKVGTLRTPRLINSRYETWLNKW